ncbi:retrotransposon protein, putative, ty1-copia subclass [Tanacetum coccineum]
MLYDEYGDLVHAINARRLPLAPLVYTLVRPPVTTSIVLSIEDKLNYLEQSIPPAPVAPEGQLRILKLCLLSKQSRSFFRLREIFTLASMKKGSLLALSLILIGLHKEFDGFMQNYNMHIMGKRVSELHAMLKLHEQTLPKNNAPALHAIRASKVQKAELLKKKKNTASGASGSCIFTIELNTFLNISWIYDTGCGTHICNTTQRLRASRKLKPGAFSLYVGNGQHEAVEAIGVFYLSLPSGLVIVLNNCHYAPTITIGVISVSRLYDDGYVNRFVDNSIQVSRNNMVYFSAVPRDGIFEIDLSNSYTNESSMYVVSNKRAKLNLDSALLWHCRLGHNSKKRIEKFRYGYVYLLKHKHEVFETFKVFQKEVENQLGETIKLLRSNRRGEYTSQEFLDHLKDHGIIAHHTPFYTPQHNGVSERRNRTLLDMVRSMMSQTTLPKSFWDYAFETDARILNMVSTKKIEKTPYEVWHGQAPKLSYLKSGVLYKDRNAPNRNGLIHDAEVHELGDLGTATYKAALLDPESDKWLNVMNVEMQSMKDNEVWDLVDLPPNGKIVGSKWLFKKKTDMDRVVHTYKARLLAKGYTQTSVIDYEETFSPVAYIRNY